MGLNIYSQASSGSAYSAGGTFTAPLTIIQDGKYGGITQKLMYVRNNDSTLWFSGTTLQVTDTIDPTLVNGTQNITWKLSAGNTQPTDAQWAAITTANTISMANLGSTGSPDTSTYLPFWLQVVVPRSVEVQTNLDVQITINTTSNSV